MTKLMNLTTHAALSNQTQREQHNYQRYAFVLSGMEDLVIHESLNETGKEAIKQNYRELLYG